MKYFQEWYPNSETIATITIQFNLGFMFYGLSKNKISI